MKDHDPKARIARARAEAEAAERELAAASRAELNKLLKQSVEKRFAALSDAKLSLTQEDRRTLLKNLQDKAPPKRAIPASTASRLELFLSRLPYRTASLATIGLAAIFALGAFLIAKAQTPEYAVRSRVRYDVAVDFRLPNGVVVSNRLVANARYGVTGHVENDVVLRLWAPGQGYASARVPRDWLERIPRPSPVSEPDRPGRPA